MGRRLLYPTRFSLPLDFAGLALTIARHRPYDQSWVAGDWTNVVTGSGGQGSAKNWRRVTTGITNPSTSLTYSRFDAAFVPVSTSNFSMFDWRLAMVMHFAVDKDAGDNAAHVGYIQVKEATTLGDMAERGIGIKIKNLALWAESYGSARAEIDLATNLSATADVPTWVTIIHEPALTRIRWYVNNVLKATQTTSANIPNALGNASANLVLSADNGATVVSAAYDIVGFKAAQEI